MSSVQLVERFARVLTKDLKIGTWLLLRQALGIKKLEQGVCHDLNWTQSRMLHVGLYDKGSAS